MSARVSLRVIGLAFNEQPEWPEGWSVPQVNDRVEILDNYWYVHSIDWHPTGEVIDADTKERSEPFAYVVIGPREGT